MYMWKEAEDVYFYIVYIMRKYEVSAQTTLAGCHIIDNTPNSAGTLQGCHNLVTVCV